MTIKTRSVFYYVEGITSDNLYLNFLEPNELNSELTAILQIGTYSMSQLVTEVQRALNDAGDITYTVSFDRDTRLVTISADDDFNLLVTTGSNSGASAYSLLGFTVNKSGTDTYEGDEAFGSEYAPSYMLQSYKDADNNTDGIRASVNESASGVVEVVTFGNRAFYEMNVKWITDREIAKSSLFENNQNSLEDSRNFLDFCITKQNLEFMKDKDNRDVFNVVLLETTRKSRQGTSYELTEMSSMDEWYETGLLKFRRVT